MERMYDALDEMKRVFSDRETTSIRIVVNPEKMVVKEAQRSFTYLNIYNFNVDAVIVNRVIPQSVTDSYFKAWKDIQNKYMAEISDSFSPIPIFTAPLFETEIVGLPVLDRLSWEVFGDDDPTDIKYTGRAQQFTKDGDNYVFTIDIPFSQKDDLSLNQKGDELFVRVGAVKRNITLPRTIAALSVKKAKFEDSRLNIWFGGGEDA
jgi:arsenite-transporting ATPase